MSNLTPDETLLGLITSRPQHGYQLLETFQDESQLGRVWKLSTSQLYAVLKRLQNQQYVLGEETESADAPPRNVYTITDLGRQHVMAWLNEPQPSPSVRRVRVEFLSRLFVAQLLEYPLSSLIRNQQTTCQHKLNKLNTQLVSQEFSVANLAVRLEIEQMSAILDWISSLNFAHK